MFVRSFLQLLRIYHGERLRLKLFLFLALIAKLTQSSPNFEVEFVKFNSEEFASAEMKICEIEFASSSIAFSVQIINELELNLFWLEFNYLKRLPSS